MATTDKYEFDTTNYGTTGWNALLATALEKADDVIHTYLRYPIASGESISAYDPVQVANGQWRKAQADGTRNPAHGIAIESGSSGEYLRAQAIGPITYSSWTFAGSGEVYLGPTGALTQVVPTTNVDLVGYSINPTTIIITPPVPLSGYLQAPSPATENNVPQWNASGELTGGLTVGTAANNLVQLDGAAKLPAVDGSQLTGLTPVGNYIPVPDPAVTPAMVPKFKNASGELEDGYSVGTAASNLVQLDGSAKLPAVDGSQLTGITGGAAAAVVYTKSSDYTVISGELGNIFRMNNSGECTFTLPVGSSSVDGKPTTFAHLTHTKLNLLAQGTNRMGFSPTVPGAMYHNVSGEAGANITLEYNNTLGVWMPTGAFGTWGIS